MEQHITADRIANSIMQDGNFENGVYLLVEGVKDIKVYGRLVDENTVRIRQTHGKYKQRDVYGILSGRGFNSKFCIRDADFLRVNGNEKFIPEFADDIFVTDGHDSEVMIFSSDALKSVLLITSTVEKIEAFEDKYGSSIRARVFELAKPIGYLRYANKIHNLGLSFKPDRPEGKKIKYKKIICDKKFEIISVDAMINTVYEYSRGRNVGISSRDEIKNKFLDVSRLNIPVAELVNGHDVSEILSIIISKGLKSDSKLIQDQESVEESLALAYESRHFHESNLYKKILNWSKLKGVSVIKK